jgi:hypothetical protein
MKTPAIIKIFENKKVIPFPTLKYPTEQNIFEDKIEKKIRPYQDIQKDFLLNFRPKR